MSKQETVDFQAVNRVARRVDVTDLRLVEVSMNAQSLQRKFDLDADVAHTCVAELKPDRMLDVLCTFEFRVATGSPESVAAEARFAYLISYAVTGDEPLDDGDIRAFAFANGTYHSWPYVREFLADLTGRMGLPPFTLPVFRFNPKPKPKPVEPTPGDGETDGKETRE